MFKVTNLTWCLPETVLVLSHGRLGELSLLLVDNAVTSGLISCASLVDMSVGSGAELLKDAVELYPPMAGPVALLAPLLRLSLGIPHGQVALADPLFLPEETNRAEEQHPGAFQELHQLVCVRISVSFLEEHSLLPCCFS